MLCRYITQEGHKLEVAPRPPEALTNAVSWRGQGIKYRKNEVFLDVIESVNLLVTIYSYTCSMHYLLKMYVFITCIGCQFWALKLNIISETRITVHYDQERILV